MANEPPISAAVIDIGSNSVKLIIGEKDKDNNVKILETLRNVIPIGKDTFFRGRISQETINQTVSFLDKYKKTLQEYGVTAVNVIATTAVREARNRDIFLDTVRRKTGLAVDVLNAGDVVYYIDAFLTQKLKKTYPFHEKNLIIVELGAGSLDISVLEKGSALMNMGVPIGTLRLQQLVSKLDGSMEEVHEALAEYIENEILYVKNVMPALKIDDIILIEENYYPHLQSILFGKPKGESFSQLHLKESEEFLAKMREGNPERLMMKYKLPVEMADTIVAFAMILNKIYRLSRNKYINILKASLPEAVLAHQLLDFEISKEGHKAKQLISLAKNICRKYRTDLNHARHVVQMAETLFNGLKDILGVKDSEMLYLSLAGYLHDLGMFVNNRSHHKHAEYVINSSSLFRLTDEEMKIIACVARYHRRGLPSEDHLIYNSLSDENQILVQKLSALLRVANALDRSHRQKAKKVEIGFNRRQDVTLTVYTNENFLIEKAFFAERKKQFEDITGNRMSLIVKSVV